MGSKKHSGDQIRPCQSSQDSETGDRILGIYLEKLIPILMVFVSIIF